jgi:molybdopterin-guanine dinucleotide biosynthesis protein A
VRKGLLPDIQMRLAANQLSVRALIENSDAEIVTWPDPAIFRNINTPEEYRSLL